MDGYTICRGEALEIASNRLLSLPNATKLCGAKGFAQLSLKDLSNLGRNFTTFYDRPVKVWTDWRRLNESHFYNDKTQFQVPTMERCDEHAFAYSFFGTVAISRHEEGFAIVSGYFNSAILFPFRKITRTTS